MSRAKAEIDEIFVDREPVLTALNEAFSEVLSNGLGKTVFVTGQPGIGKTSVVRQFLNFLDKDATLVLQSSGREFATSPFMALSEMFEPLFQKSATAQGKQIALTVLNISRLIPVFGTYAEKATEVIKDQRGLSEADSRIISDSHYVKNAFLRLFEKLSDRKPVVAFFDDVQWFDASSFEVLGFLITNATKFRALLLVASRKGYTPSEREQNNLQIIENLIQRIGQDSARVLPLEPLAADASAQMVKEISRAFGLSKPGIDSVAKRTGGNPFLIKKLSEEYLRSDLASSREDDQSIGFDLIPKSIFELSSRRLSQIRKDDSEARIALDHAAVLGRRFNVVELAEIMGKDFLEVKHLLEQLEQVYGVVQATNSGEVYEFDHDITREVIVSSLGALAGRVHLKAAEYFAKSEKPSLRNVVALHYEAAGKYDEAFRFYASAAEESMKTYSFADAIGYLESNIRLVNAAKVTATPESAATLHLGLARAQFAIGQFSVAYENATSVIEMKSMPAPIEAEARLLAGRCSRYIGTAEIGASGAADLQMAANMFQQLGDQQKVADTLGVLATVLDHFGRRKQAVAAFGQAQKAYNSVGDHIGLAILQRKSGMVYDSRRAIPFIQSAMKRFKGTGATIEFARCLNNIGAEQFYIANFAEAESSLLQSIETYRRIDSYEIDAPLNNLGLVYMQTGKFDEAYQLLFEAEKRASELFNRISSSTNLAMLDKIGKKTENALRRLDAVASLVERLGELFLQDYFAFNMSEVLHELGRPSEALEWLQKFLPNAWKGDVELVGAKRLKQKAKILRSLGRTNESEKIMKEAQRVFRTKRPQKWFYELDYYPCDIHLLD